MNDRPDKIGEIISDSPFIADGRCNEIENDFYEFIGAVCANVQHCFIPALHYKCRRFIGYGIFQMSHMRVR